MKIKGQKIKELIRQNGMTQREVADRLKISYSALSQAISKNAMNEDQLLRIAELLGVPASELAAITKSGELFNVPLINEAKLLIAKYKNRDKSGRLFPVPQIWKQNRTLKVVAAACGIRPISTHSGRHTAATRMLRKGMSKESVQLMLGHASMRTTEIYAKLEKEILKNEIRKMRK